MIWPSHIEKRLENGMEKTVDVSIEIQTKLMECTHYPNCLMQAVRDSLRTQDFSCVPCALYQQEATREKDGRQP